MTSPARWGWGRRAGWPCGSPRGDGSVGQVQRGRGPDVAQAASGGPARRGPCQEDPEDPGLGGDGKATAPKEGEQSAGWGLTGRAQGVRRVPLRVWAGLGWSGMSWGVKGGRRHDLPQGGGGGGFLRFPGSGVWEETAHGGGRCCRGGAGWGAGKAGSDRPAGGGKEGRPLWGSSRAPGGRGAHETGFMSTWALPAPQCKPSPGPWPLPPACGPGCFVRRCQLQESSFLEGLLPEGLVVCLSSGNERARWHGSNPLGKREARGVSGLWGGCVVSGLPLPTEDGPPVSGGAPLSPLVLG